MGSRSRPASTHPEAQPSLNAKPLDHLCRDKMGGSGYRCTHLGSGAGSRCSSALALHVSADAKEGWAKEGRWSPLQVSPLRGASHRVLPLAGKPDPPQPSTACARPTSSFLKSFLQLPGLSREGPPLSFYSLGLCSLEFSTLGLLSLQLRAIWVPGMAVSISASPPTGLCPSSRHLSPRSLQPAQTCSPKHAPSPGLPQFAAPSFLTRTLHLHELRSRLNPEQTETREKQVKPGGTGSHRGARRRESLPLGSAPGWVTPPRAAAVPRLSAPPLLKALLPGT